MKVAIIGSSRYTDLGQVRKVLKSLPKKTHLVLGRFSIVNKAAANEAAILRLKVTNVVADWYGLSHKDASIKVADGKQFDVNAGPRRDREIVDTADVVLAFFDRACSNTERLIKYAEDSGKKVLLVTPYKDYKPVLQQLR